MEQANQIALAILNWQYLGHAAGVSGFILACFAYKWGKDHRVRLMRRLVKRKEGAPTAEQFVMTQAADGAMEIILSKRAYKALRQDPLQGAIIGSKNQMVLRIRIKQ